MAGWKLGLLITGGLLGGFVLLVVVFALLYHYGQQEQPTGPRERAVMLTVDRVAKHFPIPFDKKHEKLKKVKHFDDSYEIMYEYDLPNGVDGKGVGALVIECNLTVDKSPSDAVASYHGVRLGIKASLIKEGLSEEVKNDLFRWGDASRFSIIRKDGRVHFYAFQARKGRKVWSLVISGVLLDTKEILRTLLTGPLEAVGHYKP